MSTDVEWEKWGARDPYFSVLTNPKYRADAMTTAAREEFFALGRQHVDHVLSVCRGLDAHFAPQRILDFGCGVGRILVPFAAAASHVVGVDISPSMLAEARSNCAQLGAANVDLVMSDDDLSSVDGLFDLVHSCIVIQHIEQPRGLLLLEQLVRRISPGGAGALHVTFAWDIHASTHGVEPTPEPPPPPTLRRTLRGWLAACLPWWWAAPAAAVPPSGGDPEMQMNFYNLSQVMFILQRAGITTVHTELTDHGGALGAFLYFLLPR